MIFPVPRIFFYDHLERDLPTPDIVKENKKQVWIDSTDPAFMEFVSDARFYANPKSMDQCPQNIVKSAQRTVDAFTHWDVSLTVEQLADALQSLPASYQKLPVVLCTGGKDTGCMQIRRSDAKDKIELSHVYFKY